MVELLDRRVAVLFQEELDSVLDAIDAREEKRRVTAARNKANKAAKEAERARHAWELNNERTCAELRAYTIPPGLMTDALKSANIYNWPFLLELSDHEAALLLIEGNRPIEAYEQACKLLEQQRRIFTALLSTVRKNNGDA